MSGPFVLSVDLNSVLPPAFLIALENTGASAGITLQTDDRLGAVTLEPFQTSFRLSVVSSLGLEQAAVLGAL